MATITKTLEIPAPIEAVWTRVADLEGVSRLFSMLADAKVEGETRTCSTVDGNQLKERILSVDPEQKRLAYAVTESPFGFEFHAASWQLEKNGKGTRLVWHTDVKPDAAAGPLGDVIDGEVPNIVRGLTG